MKATEGHQITEAFSGSGTSALRTLRLGRSRATNLPMISELLDTHYRMPFPAGWRGAERSNVDLVMLDADVVGLVTCYLKEQQLSTDQRRILEGCLADADLILPHIDGEARAYFASVRNLATTVLDADSGSPAR